MVWAKVLDQVLNPIPQPVQDPCAEYRASREQAEVLNLQWDTASWLVVFNSEVLHFYPAAHKFSRHKGIPASLPPFHGRALVWFMVWLVVVWRLRDW